MTTYTSQPSGSFGRDTYIRSDQATTNYSTDTAFSVGEDNGIVSTNRGLILFDLSSIPSNATIIDATLTLWQGFNSKSSNDRTVRVHRMIHDWYFPSVTWNNYSGSSAWPGGGGGGTGTWESTDLGTFTQYHTGTAGAQRDISLNPSLVQNWINGTNHNYGMMVISDTELNDLIQYGSSRNATQTYHPRLVINYSTTNIKAVAGVPDASISKVELVPIASIKKIIGLG